MYVIMCIGYSSFSFKDLAVRMQLMLMVHPLTFDMCSNQLFKSIFGMHNELASYLLFTACFVPYFVFVYELTDQA